MTRKRIDLTVHIDLPPARVFAAWTSPQALASWFAPMAASPPTVTMDFTVDGAYSIEMALPDGSVHTTRGVFREIDPDRRIVMSWRCDAFPDPESVVVVDFLCVDGGTDVHLVHEPFDNEATCDAHRGGWQACLAELERYLASAAGHDMQSR